MARISNPRHGRLIPGNWRAAGSKERASISTELAGANNDASFYARHRGSSGNAITITYVVAGNNTPLSVDVEGTDITVNVATNGGGAAISTVDAVRDAIEADPVAGNLISVSVSSGDPEAAVAASLTTALTGANNDLVYTAVDAGAAGNDITVTYVVSGTDTPLSVDVTGTDIVVNVETDSGDAAVSTANEVKAAIAGDQDASALVTVADAAENDGSGVVTALSETGLTGGVDASDGLGGGVVSALSETALVGGSDYVIGSGA